MIKNSVKQRRIISKFTYSDISKITGITENTLKNMVYRKKINLKNLESFIDFINYLRLRQKLGEK